MARRVTNRRPKIDDPELFNLVTRAELADILGISTNTLDDLGNRGVLPRSMGAYPLRESAQAYVAYIRGQLQAKTGTLAEEKTRLTAAQADRAELMAAELRGELVRGADVEREWSGVLRGYRARALAVPSRVGERLGHLSKYDLETVAEEIRLALTEVAEAEPEETAAEAPQSPVGDIPRMTGLEDL